MEPAQAQRILEKLVNFLRDKREAIVAEWIGSIRRDGRMQTSERLSSDELSEHLPDLLEDLTKSLQSPTNPQVRDRTDDHARSHGKHRFGQKFRLEELVREIVALRAVVVAHVAAFEDANENFRDMARRAALQRLHRFFDSIIIDAVRQFTADERSQLQGNLADQKEIAAQERGKRQVAESGLRESQLESRELREIDLSRLRVLRNTAHELRNSINSAHLAVEELQEETLAPAKAESIKLLARSIAHMDSLLSDLLEYALLVESPESQGWQTVDIHEFCHDLQANHSPAAASRGLQFDLECDPRLTTVVTNKTKLAQIANNLLSNAIKYTRAGSVRLAVRVLDRDRWSLAVEDTGPSIAPEERAQIFHEFYRSPNTAHIEGTGLGLAVAKTAAEAIGGEIRLDTQVGQGNRFELILNRGPARSV